MLRSRLTTCLFWLLVAFLTASCKQPAPSPHFDPAIDDLELVELVEGEQAIKQINKLHGKPLNVKAGFVALYGKHQEKATVWVSEAESEEAAQEQVKVMLHKMKNNPRSPFGNYRVFDRLGAPVIAFDGLRQVHYVFEDGAWVYWISADAKRIDKVLDHTLRGRPE